MTRLLVVLLAMSVASVHVFGADDKVKAPTVDKVEENLTKARDTYSTTLGEIRKDVAKLIDSKDKAERDRSNPDLAKLDALKAEKAALEKDGEMPKWLDVKTKDRITKARRPLLDALTKAKADYVQAKDDDKAALIQKEIEQIKSGIPEVVFQLPAPNKENCADAAAFIRKVLEPACKAGAVKIRGEKPGSLIVTVGEKAQTYALVSTVNWRDQITDWLNAKMVKQKRCEQIKSKDDILAKDPIVIQKP
jgi:Skp family chaperone for outer membrane proteins